MEKKMLSVRLPAELVDRLHQFSNDSNRSITKTVSVLLTEALEPRGEPIAPEFDTSVLTGIVDAVSEQSRGDTEQLKRALQKQIKSLEKRIDSQGAKLETVHEYQVDPELSRRVERIEKAVIEVHSVIKGLSFQVHSSSKERSESPPLTPRASKTKKTPTKVKAPKVKNQRVGTSDRRETVRPGESFGQREYDQWRYMVQLRGAAYVANIMGVPESLLLQAIDAGNEQALNKDARKRFSESNPIQEALEHAQSLSSNSSDS